MASSQGRGLRPGGIVRAIVRLVVLIAIGFGAGLVSGIVLEEPRLLAGHLRGESDSVELLRDQPDRTGMPVRAVETASGGPGSDENGPSSSRPRDGGEPGPPAVASRGVDGPRSDASAVRGVPARPRPMMGAAEEEGRSNRVVREKTTNPARSVTAVRGGERGWAIQVGAFADEAAAERLAAGLRDRYPVAVLPASGPGGRWRVRVQPIANEAEARSAADRLKRQDSLPTWVTRMEAGSGS